MTTIEKLRVVHGILVNIVDETSVNDTRMPAIMAARDGVAESVTELETVSL